MVSLFWILWEKGYYYFIFWCTEDTGDITLQSSLRTSKWGIGYVAQSNKQIQFLKLWDQIIIGSRIDVIAIKDFITLQVTFENSDKILLAFMWVQIVMTRARLFKTPINLTSD